MARRVRVRAIGGRKVSLIARAMCWRAEQLGGPRRCLVGATCAPPETPSKPSTAMDPQQVDQWIDRHRAHNSYRTPPPPTIGAPDYVSGARAGGRSTRCRRRSSRPPTIRPYRRRARPPEIQSAESPRNPVRFNPWVHERLDGKRTGALPLSTQRSIRSDSVAVRITSCGWCRRLGFGPEDLAAYWIADRLLSVGLVVIDEAIASHDLRSDPS